MPLKAIELTNSAHQTDHFNVIMERYSSLDTVEYAIEKTVLIKIGMH